MKAAARTRRSPALQRRASLRAVRRKDERPFFPGRPGPVAQVPEALAVSSPGDRQEREAEATADRVQGRVSAAFFSGPKGAPPASDGLEASTDIIGSAAMDGGGKAQGQRHSDKHPQQTSAAAEQQPVQQQQDDSEQLQRQQEQEQPLQARSDGEQEPVQEQQGEEQAQQAKSDSEQEPVQKQQGEEQAQQAKSDIEQEQEQEQVQKQQGGGAAAVQQDAAGQEVMVAGGKAQGQQHQRDKDAQQTSAAVEQQPVQQQQDDSERLQAQSDAGQQPLQRQQEQEQPVQAKSDSDRELVQEQQGEKQALQVKPDSEQKPVQEQRGEKQALQAKPDSEQEQQDDGTAAVQRRGSLPPQQNAEVRQRLTQSKGKGEPLPARIRAAFEQGFGADFSAVRIHTGAEAAALSRDFGAQAFTHGRDIYFNQGRYSPDSSDGRHLLAHELTHSIQQGVAHYTAPEVARDADEDLAAELRDSNQEAVQAIDPGPAEQARLEAEQQGREALADAEAAAADVGPEVPPTAPTAPADPQAGAPEGRVAEPTTRPADVVRPPPAPDDRGDAGAYLADQSADVCGDGAKKAQQLADNQSAHDDAAAKQAQSDAAVVPPGEEGASRSRAGQVETLDQAPPPATDPAAAKKALEDGVEAATPSSIEGLNEFKSKGKGKVVGSEVAARVTADVNQVKGSYSAIDSPPQPAPTEVSPPLPAPELAPQTPPLRLGKDAVPPLAAEHTDFSAYQQQSDDLLEQEGISQEQLDMVDSGELAEANQQRRQLKTDVAEQPAAVQQFAGEQATQVDQDMQREEADVRVQTQARRDQDLNQTGQRQQQVKTELELKREAVTARLNGIYEKARLSVTGKLERLESDSLARFEREQARYSVLFETEVNSDIDDWKDERYSGLFAGVKWLKDKLLGIDDFPEVKRAFERGRARFVQRLDQLLQDINRDNDKVITDCRTELTQAREQIQAEVEKLGPELRDAGLKAQADMETKLKELDGFIDKKKKALQQKLCKAKDAAIAAIDEKIEAMKASMSGVVGQLGALLLEAMLKFFEWALEKAGLNAAELMKTIRKGAAVIKQIVGDPIQFFKNMARAVGAGIQGFVTRIKKYLLQGLVEWLTGSLGEAGITLPDKFDLRGILSLVLQILGLTWANIRQKLVKKVGEKVVAGLEKTSEVVKRIIREGPMALWEMIKEKAAEIKQKVMDGIRDWVIVNIVKQAVTKLVSMLNPAGAIVQAVIAIYNVVMFFVENISRIIDFATSIIDSVAKIAAGAIGAAAGFIEQALARTVPIIIAFLARLIGLGGVGKAIKNIITTVRKPIDKVLDRVVGFVVKLAGKVVGKVKGGAVKVKDASKKVVAKLVGWWSKRTRFRAGGESHALFFKGEKPDGAIRIASEEQDLKQFLKTNKPEGSAGKLAVTYGQAVAQMTVVDRERGKLLKTLRDDKASTAQKAQADKTLKAWDDLKLKLVAFMNELKGASTHKDTDIQFDGGLKYGAIGKGATAFPLTIKGAGGSVPGVGNAIWDKVKLRRKGGGTWYIRGHLINDNLHGPGNNNENLTPISGDANKQHNRQVEEPVKDVVWNRDKKNPEGRAVRYRVKAVYAGHAVNAATVKQKIADQVQDDDRRNTLDAIVDAEQKLPTSLECTAETVERDGDGYSKKGKRFISGGKGLIPNTIPDSVPVLAGTPPKVLLRLSLSAPGSEANLRMLPGIDKVRAKAIAAAVGLAADGSALPAAKAFSSWDDFQSRAQGVGAGTVESLKNYRFRGKRVVFLSGATELGD